MCFIYTKVSQGVSQKISDIYQWYLLAQNDKDFFNIIKFYPLLQQQKI
ncbi:hypothetical protein BBROOKSOX_624 [Bathymodiolus brooksi thiotrophic gill symbiont]|nr:hypothetical protein BBROOKSOX_624 [Bathymodiolus brooksi thiotrophic gill symbiont]